ncbi:N-acetylmuramoyl-L-alanine amidase [Lapidilactobacillus gannanensis]|uniref:N-acetylmuramoyl-L-alanine amidase n=1 Tax=Lapidilactobacillus gannanensis TaxID=2486002 RepID=A0ABW4BRB3_9LACO|nr:N-acetylmuramoyl-L-alanine amidase [Lapidilactobacillus gannanensis]
MVVYDKTYALGANEGSSARASNQYIILHDTGNANNVGANSAINEASYMKRNWQSAYTHAIAGWDRVYIIGEPGYVAYGAGSPANERSPFQIELARYSDRNLALKAYANWINAAREYAAKYGIPLTLDGAGNGVKTHKWVSDNLWGDHQDPYAYLQSIGISKAQLASDIAHGVGSTVSAKPTTPSVAKSATVAQPAYALRALNASWLPNVVGKNDVNSNGYAGVPYQKHDYLTVSVPGGCQYQVHILGGGWLPMVSGSNKADLVNGAAGVGGKVIDGIRIKGNQHTVKYRVQTTQRSGWLDTVTNLSDYAGWYGEPIDRLQVWI